MIKVIQKTILLFLTLMLGISKESAAQYGVVSCNYKISGSVQEGYCESVLPGIKVSLSKPSDSTFRPVEVLTDEKGNYVLVYSSSQFPNAVGQMRIKVEDVDGEKNNGAFLPQEAIIVINNEQVWTVDAGGWERNYFVLNEQRFLLRTEQKLPCAEKGK